MECFIVLSDEFYRDGGHLVFVAQKPSVHSNPLNVLEWFAEALNLKKLASSGFSIAFNPRLKFSEDFWDFVENNTIESVRVYSRAVSACTSS